MKKNERVHTAENFRDYRKLKEGYEAIEKDSNRRVFGILDTGDIGDDENENKGHFGINSIGYLDTINLFPKKIISKEFFLFLFFFLRIFFFGENFFKFFLRI